MSPLTSHVTMEVPGCTGGRVTTNEQRTAAVQALGRGNRNWAATKRCLNNHAKSIHQVNSSGDSGWATTAIRL